MRTFDLSPLFRTTVGFERLNQMLDSAQRFEDSAPSYPPYNIEKLDEDSYRISMAIAGFGQNDVDVTVHDNVLIVSGKIQETQEERKFLHRGIATRAFERRFQLADHIKVTGASLDNGLLHIELAREVPEEAKPRKIEIGTVNATAEQPKVIEGKTQKAA
ncbi:MAG: heat-shock protein [Rhodospirillaceae bacterium]|nr:heat-shock protein [Rhodospirillaceae bacterium]